MVVHLDERRTDRYDDAEMIHIFPSVPLGGAIDGMLDFSPDGVEKRIAQGYDDAKAVLVERFGLGKLDEKPDIKADRRVEEPKIGDCTSPVTDRQCGTLRIRYVEPRILH